MIRSLWSGVSGLTAHQTKMDVIGNNIANVNTYGFKASRTAFSDIYYQAKKSATGGATTYAGNNESAVGYGVEVSSIDKDMSTSSFQSTNRILDLALAGNGFFMVADVDDVGNVNNVSYTRYGGFGVDSAGNLVNTLNQFVLGVNNYGDYNDKQLDAMELPVSPWDAETINLNDRIWEAFKDFTEIEYKDVTAKFKGTPLVKNGKDVTVEITPAGGGDAVQQKIYKQPKTIFEGLDPVNDTQTVAYFVNMNRNDDGSWSVKPNTPIPDGITPPAPPAADATAEQIAQYNEDLNAYKQQIMPYVMENANGVTAGAMEGLTGANVVFSDDDLATKEATDADGNEIQYYVQSDYILYYVDGKYVNNQGVEYDPDVGCFLDEEGNYYQYSVYSTKDENGDISKTHTYTKVDVSIDKKVAVNPDATAGTNDGYVTVVTVGDDAETYMYDEIDKAWETTDDLGNTIFADLKLRPLRYGDLEGFSVGTDGTLTATYASTVKKLGRVLVSTFDNPEGLEQLGETEFGASTASGDPVVKVPGTYGAGAVKTTRLEMSNVNLANEFSDMIVTQRGFQANARIITTSDSMLEELVNMKR